MDAETIITAVPTWAILAATHGVCWAYAYGYVRKLRRDNPEHEQTAWHVVIGNSIVSISAALIVGFAVGLDAGITTLFVLLLTNSFAGIPMIIEYTGDTSRTKRRNRNRATIRELMRDEVE